MTSFDTTTRVEGLAIVGGGIAGLTLALTLHDRGINSIVLEAAPALRPVGVGINILPHASSVLHRLGLGDELDRVAVTTSQSVFYNRFGQHVFSEPVGRNAGLGYPQYSIHRGELHDLLISAVQERLGLDAIRLDRRCESVQPGALAEGTFVDESHRTHLVVADGFVGADGVNSVVRKQLHRENISVRYSGYNMWRGVTVMEPFLDGASMVRIGWLTTGKLVVYPIRDNVDGHGRQLVNWVAEIETPQRGGRDWNRVGRLEDFLPVFEDWKFDWLHVPTMMRDSEAILEYPMIDQEPLASWGDGNVTLMGDAAHPMLPRGSNGAGQAILDADYLAQQLDGGVPVAAAFSAYEVERSAATSRVVLANRTIPPDTILKLVYDRVGDQPFDDIDNVVERSEFEALTQRYREIAAYADV